MSVESPTKIFKKLVEGVEKDMVKSGGYTRLLDPVFESNGESKENFIINALNITHERLKISHQRIITIFQDYIRKKSKKLERKHKSKIAQKALARSQEKYRSRKNSVEVVPKRERKSRRK